MIRLRLIKSKVKFEKLVWILIQTKRYSNKMLFLR
jgi:hypothetical protein